MDHLFELLVDTFSLYSHTIGFPELVVPPVAQVSLHSQTSGVCV